MHVVCLAHLGAFYGASTDSSVLRDIFYPAMLFAQIRARNASILDGGDQRRADNGR